MNTEEVVITAFASLASAVLGALLAYRWQREAEKRRDKINLFGLLMAHRGTGILEPEFVRALNLVDVIFHENREIRDLCHSYIDHLHPSLSETVLPSKILLQLIRAVGRDIGYTDLTDNDILSYYHSENMQSVEQSDKT